jgi:hypothetical protein
MRSAAGSYPGLFEPVWSRVRHTTDPVVPVTTVCSHRLEFGRRPDATQLITPYGRVEY